MRGGAISGWALPVASVLTGLAAMLLAGCTLVRMQGFDAVAAGGDRVDIQGIPLWMNGDFRVGVDGTRGHVRRTAFGRSEMSGAGERDRPDYEAGRVARYGRVRFEVAGPSIEGRLAGQCRYDREEAKERVGSVTTAAPTLPLAFTCAFTRDGQPAGELELGAIPSDTMAEPRSGRIRMGAADLTLRSIHRGEDGSEGSSWLNEGALGYIVEDPSGAAVAAIEVIGVTRRRLALPRDPALRQATLAAGIALALFRDPGDVDD